MKAFTRKQLGLSKPKQQAPTPVSTPASNPVAEAPKPVESKKSMTWEEVLESEEFKSNLFNVAVEAKKKVYEQEGVGAHNWTMGAEYPEVEIKARNAAQEARAKYTSERKIAFLEPY